MSQNTPTPTPTAGQRLRYWLTYPVIGTLLRSRAMCVGFVGMFTLQLGLSAVGVTLMDCYLLKYTGVPCPGCGLTRGAIATATVDLDAVVFYNVFGPLALVASCLMLMGAIFPNRLRSILADAVQAVERKTGVTNFCFLALWVYWLARLVILGRDLGVRLSHSPL